MSKTIVKKALSKYENNELIFASKLYKEELFNLINEAAYYKILERMCNNNELIKCSKGIYYLPKKGKYGFTPLPEKKVVDTFIKNNTGMIIGYSMYNDLKLTTQISKTIDILSSSLDSNSKTIKNVKIKHIDIEYTEDIKNMIRSLEVLQNFNNIQDINYSSFIEYSHEIANNYKDEIFKEVISKVTYKKSTISFLKEILNYHNVKHNLNQYLSSLSSYKHPKMEELYEIA